MSRWLVWIIFVVAWTVALEVPIPSPEPDPGDERPIVARRILTKSGHVVVYALMTILSGWVPMQPRHRLWMLFFLMAHGCATEWAQHLLEPYCYRGGSLRDVALDHLGIALGLAISWKWWSRP